VIKFNRTILIKTFAVAFGLFVAGISLTACNRGPDFHVSGVDLYQTSWDTISVSLTFEESDALGKRISVVPESMWVSVFGAEYDTLYTGPGSVIGIPDIELGDQEEILIEGCGLLRSRRACEQKSVFASPKRMEATSSISFPENDAFDRGTYRFDYELYRKNFNRETWSRIRPSQQPATFVKAFVNGFAADALEIPVRRSRNRFVVTRFDKYRDFRFNINSRLMDTDSAQVHFELYALLSDEPVRASVDTIIVRARSQQERLADLALLVELAGGDILTRLKGFFGLRRAYVFINDWSYQALTKMYTAEIEMHWQSSFQSEWFDMIGTLQIKSDGTRGQYEWLQGSQTAERRWFSEMEGATIRFDSLRSDIGLRPRVDTGASVGTSPGQ
jgi:hypothetical protein